ncbi:biotin/lipoyl-containing protein [Micromonospora sp. CPCC 205561]|uniref:acetyl-CoA carboxylase biotin carboxyl carrier protein n=1 Tax=Micromonospora sp. CPCC 205561 TaxID=3122407 RepID=UPI003FA56951
MSAGGAPVDAASPAPHPPGGRAAPGTAPAPGDPTPAHRAQAGPGPRPGTDAGHGAGPGHAVDAVLAELRRHARHLVAELAGPLRRVRLRSGDTVLEVEWQGPAAAAPVAARPETPPAVAEPPGRHTVRAPLVGTFYRAPEPAAAPFVSVGDLVRAGQVVGVVEAMKLMNEVTADRGGRVAELLVADGQPVEYDQPLVALDPA